MSATHCWLAQSLLGKSPIESNRVGCLFFAVRYIFSSIVATKLNRVTISNKINIIITISINIYQFHRLFLLSDSHVFNINPESISAEYSIEFRKYQRRNRFFDKIIHHAFLECNRIFAGVGRDRRFWCRE